MRSAFVSLGLGSKVLTGSQAGFQKGRLICEGRVCGVGVGVFLPSPLPVEELLWAEAIRAHLEEKGLPGEVGKPASVCEKLLSF